PIASLAPCGPSTHVAEVELVIRFARRPVEFFDAAGETFRPNRHLDHPVTQLLVGLEPHADNLPSRLPALLHHPQAAIEQSLAPVVPQTDEFLSRHRPCTGKPATLAPARVVRAPRRVAADENLTGADHARDPMRRAAPPRLRRSALAPADCRPGSPSTA